MLQSNRRRTRQQSLRTGFGGTSLNVLVFGGTGWVGHHIAIAFRDAGHAVTICSRGEKETYRAEIPESIDRVRANKEDSGEVARVLVSRFDVIIDSVPSEASIRNIAEHAHGLQHYIHCSSTGAYAPLPFVPGDETIPYDDFMGGWAQKADVDNLVMSLHAKDGFPATVIRPSYICGPGLLPLDNLGGRREDFVADILEEKPLDLPNDGLALLHPVHVCDLAAAFRLAVDQPASVGEIYNVCLPRAVTLARYLQITAAALDREVSINLMPVDAMLQKYGSSIDEIGLHFLATHMCFDITKARIELGYEPHCSTEEAIAETALWAAAQAD